VELRTFEGDKEIEADIDKKQWDPIKAAGVESVYLLFSQARIYGADETWSDWSI
jgi:sulfate transport system ATP-binding protein